MIGSGSTLYLPSSCFAFLSSSVGESGSMLTLLPYLSSVATLETGTTEIYEKLKSQRMYFLRAVFYNSVTLSES